MESIKLRKLPIACRYVPCDQWFVTHIDSSWKIKHLKQQILSKCFAISFDPRQIPLSEGGPSSTTARPPSPITFAPPRSSVSAPGDGEHDHEGNGRDSPIRFAAVNIRNPLAIEGLGSGDDVDTDDSGNDYHSEKLGRVGPRKPGEHDDGYEEDNEWEEADGPGPGGRVVVPGKEIVATSTVVSSPTTSRSKGFNALRIGSTSSGGLGQVPSTSLLQATTTYPRHTSRPQIQTSAFTLVRFTTGQILEDDFLISWYDIAPHELVELHFSLPPADFDATINMVSHIIFPTHNPEGNGPVRGKKDKHRPAPSQSVHGTPPFDPTAMGFPPLPTAQSTSSSNPLQGHSTRDTPSVLNQRTLTSLPRANPIAYIQPYWEGWVRALRVVIRSDTMETDAARYNYGQLGTSLAGFAPYGAPVLPKLPQEEVKKPRSKLEWRERWVVIKDGALHLCKDREDLEPTHRLPLTNLMTLRGAEHLVQSISRGPRGRPTHTSGRDAVNEKDGKGLRPPTVATSPLATRTTPSAPHPIETNQSKRARGASDAGLLSPTSRNKGDVPNTGDLKERGGVKDGRRRSISPRSRSRETSNAVRSNVGKERDPGISTVRTAKVDDAPGPSSLPGNHTTNVIFDPKSRTTDGTQPAGLQRPLTEAEIQKRRLEREKRVKEREEEKKRKQKEQEQLEALMRWDDFGWGKRDKAKDAKEREKERQKAKERERERRERREREEEKRREKEHVRSKGEIEREKEKERQKEREMEKEREREMEKEREREREKQREKEKEREREKQRLFAKRHDKTYIPISTEEAELIGMKIVCAKFKVVRKSEVKEQELPQGFKYTSTGPTLAGDPPLPPHPPDSEFPKRDFAMDESLLSQRKASLPHLGLNFLTTTSGPSSSHPTKEGVSVKFGLPGLFGKDREKKEKKEKKRDDEDHHEDDEQHHASTTGLGWKLGRKKKPGGGDIGNDFEVVSMPAVLERSAISDAIGGRFAAEAVVGPLTSTIGGVMSTVVQNREAASKPTGEPLADAIPPAQARVKPQRPAVVTTLLNVPSPIAPDAENHNTDVESQQGQELNTPTSDSMSLSSPVFAHSTDEDSMDNDSILGGPRKPLGERVDRKGYRYGGYHTSGPTKGKEKEKEKADTENAAPLKTSAQLTMTSSTHSANTNQPPQPIAPTSVPQLLPVRPAPPPPPANIQQSRQVSAQTLATSTTARRKDDEKGEWIVLDMGSDHAFYSILRIFHRHFLPPITTSFFPFLNSTTPSGRPSTLPKDSVEKNAMPPAPEATDRSNNTSLQTVETPAASIGNDKSINIIPPSSLAVPYPEWRLEILSKARTHGMGDSLRPLDLASRGCAEEVGDNDDDVSRLRKESEANVSSKAYAHLRRMSAQSRVVLSPSTQKRRSKTSANKRSRKGKERTKAPYATSGDTEGASLDNHSISISVSQEDTGSLADEEADVDEADEYEDDEDDDDESFVATQVPNTSLGALLPLPKRLDNADDGLFDASDEDSLLADQEDNIFSLVSFVDSEEESEREWMAWMTDIPRQVQTASERKISEQEKIGTNTLLRVPQSSVTLFSNPFSDSSSHHIPTNPPRDSWIPKIHAEEMRLVAESKRRLELSGVGMSRSFSEGYSHSTSTYHYGYPYYAETESLSPRQERSLDSMRAQRANYSSDSPSYGSQPGDFARDPFHTDTRGFHRRQLSSSSTESLSITLYHNRLTATTTRNQFPESPVYDSPPMDHSQDYDDDDVPPVPPVPDEYLSHSPRSPTFVGASPTKSSTTTTPRHVRKHSRSLSGAIGSSYSSHPPLSPSSKQASGLYHSASFHTPTRNESSGLSSSRPDMPILSPEQISRIERETDQKISIPTSGAASSMYASSSRGGLSVYDSYSTSTGSRTANTSSVSVNNPYGHATSSGYNQMFDNPLVRVKVEQASSTASSALHASTSYPSMANLARSPQPSTPSTTTSTAANVLQSAGRGFVSLIHGNLIPRRSSSAGLLGKPNAASATTPQEGPSVTFASSPASSLGRSPSHRLKAQGMTEKERGPNFLRKRLSDLNRDRPPIPVMSSSPPNANLMSPRQRPKLSLHGVHTSPSPRDGTEPTSPRLYQIRSPTSTTMGINSPMEPWSTVDTDEPIYPSAIGPVQVPGSSSQSSSAMASARALLRRVRSGSSLQVPMGMHMEEPGSPETPYGVNNHSRSP